MTAQERIDVFEARVVGPDAGRAIPLPLHPISQLVAGRDMPANVSLFDMTLAPRTPGAPPHMHSHEDEIYHVLEGALTFLIGTEVVTAESSTMSRRASRRRARSRPSASPRSSGRSPPRSA